VLFSFLYGIATEKRPMTSPLDSTVALAVEPVICATLADLGGTLLPRQISGKLPLPEVQDPLDEDIAA
jgi:hypothetical protein